MTNENEVYSEEYRGLTIRIYRDVYADNPFESDDYLPDVIGFHRRYNFNTRKEDSKHTPESFLKEAKEKGYVTAPLFMYEHGGLAFSLASFNDPWDSGQLGIMFWTREKIANAFGEAFSKRLTKSRLAILHKQLVSACDLLNDYHSGNVYGFVIENDDGEELDSCWGFYGNYDGKDNCLSQAREAARGVADSEAENAALELAMTQARIQQYQSELEKLKNSDLDLALALATIRENITKDEAARDKLEAHLTALSGDE